ncbi:MAG: DsbA family oxidoreductase [Acidobacteria bacterium]|nr:DsbA family oxidoreductase [Acidobacteriota bacterium]
MTVEIYSDVVCPWCYIGERRFARALAAFPHAADVDVVFRPFQLDPGAPRDAVPTVAHLEHRFGGRVGGMLARVSHAAQGEGIAMAWDTALFANTRTAHRLLNLARQEYGHATQRALADRLFALTFTEGGNIADGDQLADAAVSVGMPRDRVRAYLASGEGAAALDTEFQHARDLGITAVPTFVIDGQYVVQGAQPAATFLEALNEASRKARGTSAPDESDECADGVCQPRVI